MLNEIVFHIHKSFILVCHLEVFSVQLCSFQSMSKPRIKDISNGFLCLVYCVLASKMQSQHFRNENLEKVKLVVFY